MNTGPDAELHALHQQVARLTIENQALHAQLETTRAHSRRWEQRSKTNKRLLEELEQTADIDIARILPALEQIQTVMNDRSTR